MEEVLEKCLDSSDNESYSPSMEDLFIVSSSKSVNDSWMDIVMAQLLPRTLLNPPVLSVVRHG